MTTITAIARGERARVHDERAGSQPLARRGLAHSPSMRARRAAPALRAVRAAVTAIALVCVGLHAWLAVAAPDWRAFAMLGLAAACAACLLHRREASPPSTGEWGVMAVAALAMLVIHLTGAAAGGGHHAALASPGDVDASAAGPTGAVHAVAVVVAVVELGIAMLALLVCGVRRRAHRESGTPVP